MSTRRSGCDDLLAACDDYDVKGLRGAAHEANAHLREAIDRLRGAAEVLRHRAELEALGELARDFAVTYRAIKRARGVLDFDDLQEAVVRIFESQPDIAQRYRRHFALLMIDEFQDTNDLQMRVLAPLRSDNLCVVGDERQSIYGFRYADVDIFRGVTAAIGAAVELKDNFRSHPEIIGFVNAVFSQPHLFGEGFMRLAAGRPAGHDICEAVSGPRIECIFVDEDGVSRKQARVAEAAAIAERIRALVDQDVPAGDIAVLLRVASNATLFADAIEALGVPVVVSAGAGLYDTAETGEVIDLLRAIAVPDDDEAMLGVLCGRMVSLSDDALLSVRRSAGKGSLWEGLSGIASGDEWPGVADEDQQAILHAREALVRLEGDAGPTLPGRCGARGLRGVRLRHHAAYPWPTGRARLGQHPEARPSRRPLRGRRVQRSGPPGRAPS